MFGFQTITMWETRSGITLDVEGPRGPVPPRDPRRLGRPYTISPGRDLALAVQLALRACWPAAPTCGYSRRRRSPPSPCSPKGAGDPGRICAVSSPRTGWSCSSTRPVSRPGTCLRRHRRRRTCRTRTVRRGAHVDQAVPPIADSSYNGVIVTGSRRRVPRRCGRRGGTRRVVAPVPEPAQAPVLLLESDRDADAGGPHRGRDAAPRPRSDGEPVLVSGEQPGARRVGPVPGAAVHGEGGHVRPPRHGEDPLTAAQPMQAVGRSRQVWA